MHAEYLPATGAAQQSLVLLHGWGCDRQIWRALVPLLRPWADLTLLDIPGCSPVVTETPAPALADVLDGILAVAPGRAVYVGFSLGGQLATALASRVPERVAGLVTVCSNPRFVAGDGWPGMPSKTFEEFSTAYTEAGIATLARFGALQVLGCRERGALLRLLKALTHSARAEGARFSARAPAPVVDLDTACAHALHSGLHWLAQLDLRAELARLTVPQWHLLAGNDALVPPAAADAIRGLLPPGDAHRVRLLADVGHLAPLAEPQAIASLIGELLMDGGLRETPAPRPAGIPKRAVAESFSRAAGSYDSVAHLQQKVGAHLLGKAVNTGIEPETVLDLGCGTGFFAPALRRHYPQACYLGMDLAPGMLSHARTQHAEAGWWVAGDAESLPLAAGSVDLIFSSLALQWCDRLALFFAEIERVLRPGGMCVFTSLGPGTLCELRAAWAEVDTHPHVNRFAPVEELQEAARSRCSLRLQIEQQDYVLSYPRVRTLLHELKALGAHNMNPGRPAGLAGRAALQGMLRAYETRRCNGVLPATYDVIFGKVEKL
ncbi:MAG: malonyl-ACP O-methyltransferase BioC [Halioglobus sp.]